MKKVFITGAAGFIGRMLVKQLIKDNMVYALVLPSENPDFGLIESERLSIVRGNLEEADNIVSALKDESIDLIYHLAWVGVSTKYKNDYEMQFENVRYALNLMRMSKQLGCNKVIITGSVSEYAYAKERVNGKQIPSPSDAYSATKASVHIYCDLFARQNEMVVNWVLIPSIYGPGRDDNNLITYCIKCLLSKERPSFTKLEQKWDYIYITDLINALVLIGNSKTVSKTYSVGSGENKTLAEYVKIIRDLINSDAELGIGDLEYKTKVIDNSIVDISDLVNDLGYEPKVTFEKGIVQTIEYFKGMVK